MRVSVISGVLLSLLTGHPGCKKIDANSEKLLFSQLKSAKTVVYAIIMCIVHQTNAIADATQLQRPKLIAPPDDPQ